MNLSARQKLDVDHQTRSNPFGRRGPFTADSKPVEFDGFGSCGEFGELEGLPARPVQVGFQPHNTP